MQYNMPIPSIWMDSLCEISGICVTRYGGLCTHFTIKLAYLPLDSDNYSFIVSGLLTLHVGTNATTTPTHDSVAFVLRF